MCHFLPHLIEQHQIWNKSFWHVRSCNLGVESFWIVSWHKQCFLTSWAFRLHHKVIQRFKSHRYMNTGIRHLNTKFFNYQKDPASMINFGVGKSIIFDIFNKKRFFWCQKMTTIFFQLSGTEKLPLADRHNCAESGAYRKRDSKIGKKKFTEGFPKSILLAIALFFL